MTKPTLSFFGILLISLSLVCKAEVIFFDDFNTKASYDSALTKNATNLVYKTNSLPAGHLLKKWNYSWEYQYLEGGWKQAFYVVAPGETLMTQAGRSASFYGECFYRITAKTKIPETATRYRIELKQYKNDNDPLYYALGADVKGRGGVEIGYENQIPGTDESVKDAYLRGTLLEGLVLRNKAYHKEWVDVSIEVDVVHKRIHWKMDGETIAEAYAKDLKPGGHFGIFMSYERNTKFDDIKITILE